MLMLSSMQLIAAPLWVGLPVKRKFQELSRNDVWFIVRGLMLNVRNPWQGMVLVCPTNWSQFSILLHYWLFQFHQCSYQIPPHSWPSPPNISALQSSWDWLHSLCMDEHSHYIPVSIIGSQNRSRGNSKMLSRMHIDINVIEMSSLLLLKLTILTLFPLWNHGHCADVPDSEVCMYPRMYPRLSAILQWQYASQAWQWCSLVY